MTGILKWKSASSSCLLPRILRTVTSGTWRPPLDGKACLCLLLVHSSNLVNSYKLRKGIELLCASKKKSGTEAHKAPLRTNASEPFLTLNHLHDWSPRLREHKDSSKPSRVTDQRDTAECLPKSSEGGVYESGDLIKVLFVRNSSRDGCRAFST